MNLRQIEIFRCVMQTGSIKGAAALLHVTPPAVSKLLEAAERACGITLFERVKGRLVATPEAVRLYDEVEQVWQRVEHLRTFTRELALPSGAALHLAISPSLGASIVPRAVTALIDRTPDARITVDQQIPHLLVKAIVDGVSDIGVTLSPQTHPSVDVLARYPCKLVCVMPAGHPLARKKSVAPADLLGHPVISFPQALAYGMSNVDLYGRQADQIRSCLDVRSGPTACWFSMAGAGVAIVDDTSVAGGVFPSLTVRPYRCGARLAVHLLKHYHRPLSRMSEAFCEAFDATWRAVYGGGGSEEVRLRAARL
ncbi:LysR family transcriptional regulator [Verticiella sediminum]|uniref:LysR family transcriptional regulator n=1 Tax=Verticiella sediminum TaxID=1247510 RepID=A0A556ABU4_9BURK|nr:LysR substrate-binding domain-containing protein [Verticiella sediminum]TSH90343.1 LysR family transcriptional regulator [Verticiella sediminum]